MRVHGQTKFNRALNSADIHHRQSARQRQVHRASLRIGFRAKRGRRAAKNFALRGQLRVCFEANDDFVALY